MNYLTAHDLLNEPQRVALGLIVAEWALLEATMSVAIWDYLELNRDHGMSVTADLSSLAKINMLRSLAILRFDGKNDEACGKIKGIMGEIKRLNTDRNTMIHNMWSPDYVAGGLRSKRATTRDGKLTEKPLQTNTEELIFIFEQITGYKADLLLFQTDYGVTPPSRTK